MDLTGNWTGHYRQRTTAHAQNELSRDIHFFPLEVSFSQSGELLVGTMVDLISVFSESLEQMKSRNRQFWTKLEMEAAESWLAQDPHVRVQVSFPAVSWLEGFVVGDQMYFYERYCGDLLEHYTGRFAGNCCVARQPHPSVEYAGTISPDGQEIEGTWYLRLPFGSVINHRFAHSGTFRFERGEA